MSSNKEPLTQENTGRFVLFPIKYADMWDMYKKQVAVFWKVKIIQKLNEAKMPVTNLLF